MQPILADAEFHFEFISDKLRLMVSFSQIRMPNNLLQRDDISSGFAQDCNYALGRISPINANTFMYVVSRDAKLSHQPLR
jgi:hypothetical protein